MALSIDTIRNFAGSKSIMLDQRRMDFTSAPLQKFRCYFNIGDARQRNAETLVAIHQAILNDPRFAAHDIHAEAARLLGELDAERAVTAGQITGILQKLDEFAQDTKKRVVSHLAATMPAWAAGHEEEVASAVLTAVTNNRRDEIDLSGLVGDALDSIHTLLTHAGNDPALREVLFRTLKNTLFESNHTLASHEKLQQRVDAFREDVAHLNACAERSADPAAVMRVGVDFLSELGKPVHPSVIDMIDEFACNLPFKPLGSLGPESSASDIVCAVHRMAEALRTKPMSYPEGVAPLQGGDEVLPLNVFMVQRAIAELPESAQANLLAAFESEEGRTACSYIAYEAGDGAERDFYIVNYASKYLQKLAGKPQGYPGTYDELPDLSKFSPFARCAFDVKNVIVGNASDLLRANVLDPFKFGRQMCPGAALHNKIDAAAKTMTSCTFASEMKKLATGFGTTVFDKDITRGLAVTLPDGRRLSNDRALARDELAQLVSGDPNATYANLSPADRAKANVFIALLSQETEKAVETGVPLALSPDGNTAIFGGVLNKMGAQPTRTFAISGSPAEGFSIHYNGDFPYMIINYEVTEGKQQVTPMGQHISAKYELQIDISADAMEKVSTTDWASYDGTASDAIMEAVNSPNRLERSYNAIPEGFRLDADVTAGFTIQVDAN